MRRSSMIVLAFALAPATAFADGDPAAAPPAPMPPPAGAVAPMPPPQPAARTDAGFGFRNGFSASIGEEFGSGPSSKFSGQLYGFDWRIGVTIAHDWAAYVQTHLSLGTAQISGASGYTGNFATAVLGERTLPGRSFVAGGVGYGVLNHPSGPLAQLRGGWYPFATDDAAGPKRRLNVALDARWYFAGSAIGTVTQIAITIGYDRF